jgi:hypothetical protein
MAGPVRAAFLTLALAATLSIAAAGPVTEEEGDAPPGAAPDASGHRR